MLRVKVRVWVIVGVRVSKLLGSKYDSNPQPNIPLTLNITLNLP